MSARPAPNDVSLSGRQEATGEPDPETLRLRMREIRNELQSDVDEVVDRAGELTDWRYYVRTYPWASVAVAAAVGYWLVPKLSGGRHRRSSAEESRSVAERGSSSISDDRGRSRSDRGVGSSNGTGSARGTGSEERGASHSKEPRSKERGGASSDERGWLFSAAALLAPVVIRAGTVYLSQRIAQAMEAPSPGSRSAGEAVSSSEGRPWMEPESVPRDVTSGGEF